MCGVRGFTGIEPQAHARASSRAVPSDRDTGGPHQALLTTDGGFGTINARRDSGHHESFRSLDRTTA